MNIRMQNLRDSDHERQWYYFHRRGWIGWPAWFEWEMAIKKKVFPDFLGAYIRFGGMDENRSIGFNISFLIFHLFWTLPKALPKRLAKDYECFEEPRFSVIFHGASIHISFWRKTWVIRLDEKLFGRRSVEYLNAVDYKNVEIAMPERVYHANVRISHDTWTYKRWPWWPLKKIIPRSHIDVIEKTGIPTPGKGTMSYNCGDDGIFGLCCPAKNLDEAVENLRSSVIADRNKYGSGINMYLKNARQ